MKPFATKLALYFSNSKARYFASSFIRYPLRMIGLEYCDFFEVVVEGVSSYWIGSYGRLPSSYIGWKEVWMGTLDVPYYYTPSSNSGFFTTFYYCFILSLPPLLFGSWAMDRLSATHLSLEQLAAVEVCLPHMRCLPPPRCFDTWYLAVNRDVTRHS